MTDSLLHIVAFKINIAVCFLNMAFSKGRCNLWVKKRKPKTLPHYFHVVITLWKKSESDGSPFPNVKQKDLHV